MPCMMNHSHCVPADGDGLVSHVLTLLELQMNLLLFILYTVWIFILQSSNISSNYPVPSVSRMHATALLYIVILATATLFTLCESHAVCAPCINRLECEEPPQEVCNWGEARDYCGRRVCAKGPGERCGGRYDRYGLCGEGMMCTTALLDHNVHRCRGCSTFDSIECYPSI